MITAERQEAIKDQHLDLAVDGVPVSWHCEPPANGSARAPYLEVIKVLRRKLEVLPGLDHDRAWTQLQGYFVVTSGVTVIGEIGINALHTIVTFLAALTSDELNFITAWATRATRG